MSALRVLHIVPSLAASRGGPSEVVAALSPALVAEGVEVEILASAAGLDAEGERAVRARLGDVPTTIVPIIGTSRVELSPRLVLELARRVGRFDLVHLHTVFTFPLVAAAMACRLARVPYVLRPAGTLDDVCLRSRSYAMKRLALATWAGAVVDGAAALHATSPLEARELTRWAAAARIHEAELGADGSTATADHGSAGRRIATLGRLHHMKGLELLIDALVELPGVVLEIAGGGDPAYAASLERRVASRGLTSRVRFRGPVAAEGKAALFDAAELLVFPSLHESFGIAIAEAMASGRAVVVSDRVGIADVIAEAGAGQVVSRTPVALAHAIRAYLQDGAARASAAARARALARDRYTWASAARRTAALYAGVLRR